jgi:hypothetical protein
VTIAQEWAMVGDFEMGEVKSCRATGNWVLLVPANFEELNNGDSWQAHADTRTVYVSSMKAASGGSPVPVAALRATVSRKLGPPSAGERHDFAEAGVEGEAQVTSTDAGFELKGFTCVDGCVATCLISFQQPDQRDWALATWRSLQPLDAAVKTKPWWRFW